MTDGDVPGMMAEGGDACVAVVIRTVFTAPDAAESRSTDPERRGERGRAHYGATVGSQRQMPPREQHTGGQGSLPAASRERLPPRGAWTALTRLRCKTGI